MELRKEYAGELARLMRENDKIIVLDADLAGAGGTKPLYAEFPDRCIEVGIAEANMACIAAGLAASGYIPFIHTFVPFVARRALDQIAVSVCYSEQNVRMIAFDPGVHTGSNGGTHMSFEDIATIRAFCNIAVLDIVDGVQLRKALPYIVQHKGPMYIRVVRKQTDVLFGEDYKFEFGKADKLRDGKDITIVASGTMLFDAVRAADRLIQEGKTVDLLGIHTSDLAVRAQDQARFDGGKSQHPRRTVRSSDGIAFRQRAHPLRRGGSARQAHSGGQRQRPQTGLRSHRKGRLRQGDAAHRTQVNKKNAPASAGAFFLTHTYKIGNFVRRLVMILLLKSKINSKYNRNFIIFFISY